MNGTDTLNFSKHTIDVELFEAVAKYYCCNSMSGIMKTKLLLSETNLTNDGLNLLLKHLGGFERSITKKLVSNTLTCDILDLSTNQINDEGCKMIAQLIRKDVHIKSINLSQNLRITLVGMCEILKAANEKQKLISIDFSYCDIKLSSANFISQGPYAIRTEGQTILEDLAWNCSLCELKLVGNEVDPRFLDSLV